MSGFLHVWGLEELLDARLSQQLEAKLATFESAPRLEPQSLGRARKSTVFWSHELDAEALARLGERLRCPISEESFVGLPRRAAWSRSALLIGAAHEITDERAQMAAKVAAAIVGREVSVHSGSLYELEAALPMPLLQRLGAQLAHPLIERVWCWQTDSLAPWPQLLLPPPPLGLSPAAMEVVLPADDDGLEALSLARGLSLSRQEMRAIADHFAAPAQLAARALHQLPAGPTDVELEVLAQTWSEHCKHKEFAARVQVQGDHGARSVDSLFRSYIERATENVRAQLEGEGAGWLLSVFADNAGAVAYDATRAFVFKVETHNSPSALEPYHGALTGVLGCNRDALGTGRGGARLVFNTNVLCFGPLDHDQPLLRGQLHPRAVYEGVTAGIRDAGNHSGVPTVNGAVLFEPRFAGKPLVYCGSGALMPRTDREGRSLLDKRIAPGDLVIMLGGRVGRDGIGGATFSSRALEPRAARGAVQMGDPFVQKLLADLLREACPLGLVAALTDNGAGGLASSVGELARLSGGARIDVAEVPRKAAGLSAWEVVISESQERMTLAVSPQHLEAFCRLAAQHEVECSVIGEFTDSGAFEIHEGERRVGRLELEFLHEGWPRLELQATIPAPVQRPWSLTAAEPQETPRALLLALLATPNVCSRERLVRRYDHEVQGRTVLKPYMQRAPQDAAVLRVDREAFGGVAVASGICPQFGDLDAYQASACAFDEAVRSVIAVGARLPFGADVQEFFCACDNFCMPNVRPHPELNPDGREKLGKLVRMTEALYDVATAWRVPLISGKDSMKNDMRGRRPDGTSQTISVPPTVLYTVAAKIRDVRAIVSAELKAAGDVLYVLSAKMLEGQSIGAGLGASQLSKLLDARFGQVPTLDLVAARDLYRTMAQAHERRLLASCHDLSDGGLAVALAEACLGGGLGARVTSPSARGWLAQASFWFGEEPSRFLVSVRKERAAELELLFGARALHLGEVGDERLVLDDEAIALEELARAYEGMGLP